MSQPIPDVTPPQSTQFRWRRYDSPDEEWSQWHQVVTGAQKCLACCCPSVGLGSGGIPALCECGAREHQEPAEAMTFWDTDHIRACQGCDLSDPEPVYMPSGITGKPPPPPGPGSATTAR